MRAKLPTYVRARLESQLERRKQLVEKALRDPERFFADARSPYVRRAGAIAHRLGWFPAAASDAEAKAPRSVPRSRREYALVHAVAMTHGSLESVEGNRLRGVASSGSTRPVALVVHLDGEEIARFVAVGEFDVCVDMGQGDGRSASLVLACATSAVALQGCPRNITVPRYEGAVTNHTRGRLRGYIRDIATAAPVYLDIVVDARVACTMRVGRDARRKLPLPVWFTHAFAAGYVARRADTTLELRIRGTDRAVLGTPLAFDLPRREPTLRARIAPVSDLSAGRIHVLIPAYSGTDVTLRCVDSVLHARNESVAHVTVIWDAGPDVTLLEALRARASSGAFTLLENAENLGFVRTCNRGMRLHPNDDVVLLNADTEVADGWLDRLARAARSAPDIGTATPFSNAATICTYPKICEERALPEDETVASVDARFARVNAGQVLDLPTGHGFCLFIRRAMLDAVGLFDEEAFGRGYGEENDLCLRGRAAGFRSVLAGDVFVKHVGSVSFGEERGERVRHALDTLRTRYPDYHEAVSAFIRRDPAARLRNRVVVDSLRTLGERSDNGTILMVTHHLGGGIEINVRMLEARLVDEGFRVAVLSSHPDGTLRLRDALAGLEATYFDTPELAQTLVEDLRHLAPRLVHVHHVLTFPGSILDVITSSSVPFDVTLHDYFSVCPRVNFVRANGAYCGEPAPDACDVCLAADASHEAMRIVERAPPDRIASYRAHQLAWLKRARRVIAPSHDTASRINRVFPMLPITVLPHPDAGATRAARRVHDEGVVHVAVLGGIGLHKGYRRLVDVARHAASANLPLRFVVFGTTLDSGALRVLPNITVSGRYTPEELPTLVARTPCSVALFLSIWPETYSYTLSEALDLGLHPVCLDIGAPAERLRALGLGTLLAYDATEDDVCRALLDRRSHAARTPRDAVPLGAYDDIANSYYGLDVVSA